MFPNLHIPARPERAVKGDIFQLTGDYIEGIDFPERSRCGLRRSKCAVPLAALKAL